MKSGKAQKIYLRPHDLSYSVRRYFIDEFYSRHITDLPKGGRIIDFGGLKEKKRGQFNIDKYDLKVEHVNLDEKTGPDYLCGADHIPTEDNLFDGVICSELLEHVLDPKAVLKEAYRVLKPRGVLLLCAPFMFKIHADPYDYGRYTDLYYHTILKELGFKEISIEKQGLFFCVLANMIKLFANDMHKEGKPKNRLKKKVFHKAVFFFVKKAFEIEKREYYKKHDFFNSFTTGYGVKAVK